jgi:hypothetical protein
MHERRADWLADKIRADAEMSESLKEQVIDAMARAWDAVVSARAAVACSRQTLQQIAAERLQVGEDSPLPLTVSETPEFAA